MELLVVKNLSISNFKNILFIAKILFLLIAILLTESFFDSYLEQNNENKSFRTGRRLLNQISSNVINNVDIIIVGDSSCNAAIDVSVITQVTGFKAVKLAPPARYAQMSGYYFLKEYLKKNPPPKILLDIRTPSLMSANWSPELFFDNFFDFIDCYEMISKGIIKPNDFLFNHLPNFLISFRNRFALKRIYGEKVSLLKSSEIDENIIKNDKKTKNRMNRKRKIHQPYIITKTGVFVFNPDSRLNSDWFEGMADKDEFPYNYRQISKDELNYQVGQYSYKFKNILYDNGLKPYRVATSYRHRLKFFNQVIKNNDNIITNIDLFYIEKILSLCQKNNVSYYFFQGPLFEGLHAHKIGKQFYDKVLIELKKLSNENPAFLMLSEDILLFPFRMLTNTTEHLDTTGRNLYSKQVALMLNEILK
jgi:hypothetical protein